MSVKQLIQRYYDAFNRGDMATFFDCLHENVVHDINQGDQEKGKAAFQAFMQRMNRNYQEQVTDLLIFTSDNAERAAAEFTIVGKYLVTDSGLPEAKGQTYHLPCGAFFAIKEGKISRVSNYYNLNDWLDQVKR